VVFTDAGLPMLANLGAARLRGDIAPVHSTPDYIDPGVAAGFLPGPQSDVFMLAGVAVHALTGAALWPGEGVEHVLLNALIADVESLDGRLEAAAVPASLHKVLRRALAVEPGGRGTAAQLALDLRASAPGALGAQASRLRIAAASAGPVDAAARAPEPAARAPEPAGPPTPRGRGGHRYHHPKRGRPSMRVLVGGALVGALLVGGVLAWAFSNAGAKHPAAASVASSPAALAPVPAVDGAPDSLSVDPVSPSGGSSPPAAGSIVRAATAADASNALVELDALREQAFARRAPLLLTGVYEPGVLLDEDTASLERIVPAGCGLEGVHTAYSDVQITGSSDSEIDLTAQATLSSSVLFCNGVAKARAPGSGPSALHMVLIRSGPHFLIHSVSG
jgi:hypothetical protein